VLATNFLGDVYKALDTPRLKGRVNVLITGRTYAIQSHESSFREHGQILHLLPYNIDGVLGKKSVGNQNLSDLDQALKQRLNYEQDNPVAPELLKLLNDDQRDEWWRKYGELTGQNYPACPEKLKEGVFGELTGQPLLNHLAAKVYREGRIDFSSEANPNKIYEEIINSVYRRPWGEAPHPTLPPGKPLGDEEKTFNRVLEEIGVCAWQGGRCASVGAIEQRCKGAQFNKLMKFLGDRAKNPMKLLFTGFFFRDVDRETTGDGSIEFTHKTFYEYLTARRIVRQIQITSANMAKRRDDADYGWGTGDALIHWSELCGPTAMDWDLFTFVVNEVKLQSMEKVRQWQEDLRELIQYTLTHGMPRLAIDKTITYKVADGMARNAEEALLACMSACARTINDEPYHIKWPTRTSAGDWICRLRGQRKPNDLPSCFALNLFNHINMSGQFLLGQDLIGAELLGADLSSSNLSKADLGKSNIRFANLRETNLSSANLYKANLRGSDLCSADLRSASLWDANLISVNLERANLVSALLISTRLISSNLSGADLSDADLSSAHLHKSDLSNANCRNAILMKTDLSDANLSFADLRKADLREAGLRSATLIGAKLLEADLRGADLRGADLREADLREADLRNADLRNADLRAADFRYPRLDGANLTRTKLEGAKGLPRDLSPYLKPPAETDEDED
jgi:uncharacterized protein YjbI with pentapeptide repeats